MRELKGLILSGGAGTRLRPITHTSAKQLVPVANKPVLFYGIEALVSAGVTEIGIVIAPETGAEIREAVGDGAAFGARVTYIVQDQPQGLAHAVLTAADYLDDSPFVMYLGDNLLRDGIEGLVTSFREAEPDALILLTQVPDPSAYGVAELDGDRVVRLIEKPSDPPSDLALVGVYLFGAEIIDAARGLKPSARGELEITEAIQALIDDGHRVESEIVSGWWKDTGQLEDMLEANRLVLDEIEPSNEGELHSSKVEGRVVIEEGAVVSKSTIRGPAIIGRGATVTEAYIGPYTSVGAGVTVERSEVEHSIILEGSQVRDLGVRLEASLLGRNVIVERGNGRPRTLTMMVGDNSQVELSMKLLVTGAGGMLGRDVVLAATNAGHEVAAYGHLDLDITDAARVRDRIEWERPDVVINCAAWTDVDGAEDSEEEAMEVNGTGAGAISAAAAAIDATVVCVSSDYVFDGAKGTPYVEVDQPGPLSAYGRTKLAGEEATAAANPRHFIVRSAWLFGVGGSNFVETMLRLAADHGEVLVVRDQVGSPTYTWHLAYGIVRLIESAGYGIHHMAATDSCSWYDFAREIFDQAGVECRVLSATTEMLSRPAPRPPYSVLATQREHPILLPSWRDGLSGYLAQRQAELETEEAPGP